MITLLLYDYIIHFEEIYLTSLYNWIPPVS